MYDVLDRVTGRVESSLYHGWQTMWGHKGQQFEYDAGGNITLMGDYEFGYGAGNRLIEHDGQTVAYDADDNMTYGFLGGIYYTRASPMTRLTGLSKRAGQQATRTIITGA